MKNLILTILLSFLSLSLFSQSVTTTVDVGGVSDAICVGDFNDINGEYDCKGTSLSPYPDGWYSELLGGGPGTTFYNFSDPVPSGNVITNICITLFNANCDGAGYIEVQGTNVMFMLSGTDCSLGNIPCGTTDLTICSAYATGVSSADYNYGGLNIFDLDVSMGSGGGDAICFTHADIIFEYEAITAVPTIGEWGIMLLILGLVSIGCIGFYNIIPKIQETTA